MTHACNVVGDNAALARIDWQGLPEHLGVKMVNRNRESFFLYAEPFIEMMLRQDEYVLVKLRDNEPEKAINHHGGDIWGAVDVAESTMTITLYFGTLYQDIRYDPDTGGLFGVIGEQEYRFAVDRLTALLEEIELIFDELREFDGLLRAAKCTPLQASFMQPGTSEDG